MPSLILTGQALASVDPEKLHDFLEVLNTLFEVSRMESHDAYEVRQRQIPVDVKFADEDLL